MQIVYLNDCYGNEEKIMIENGVSCIRINYPFVTESLPDMQEDTIIRGPKMSVGEYTELFNKLKSANRNTITNAGDYKRIADATEYSRCFGKYAPKVLSFDRACTESDILDSLSESDIKYPLFVRSEVESAAKYVGVDACILKENTIFEIKRVLQPISKHIVNAKTIIMKEIIPIKRINGNTVEYRSIVVNGQIICFDYNSLDCLPNPVSLQNASQFQDCVNLANKNGLHGAYFLDFGIDEQERVFVIECKNIINGTVKHAIAFAQGLKHLKEGIT